MSHDRVAQQEQETHEAVIFIGDAASADAADELAVKYRALDPMSRPDTAAAPKPTVSTINVRMSTMNGLVAQYDRGRSRSRRI